MAPDLRVEPALEPFAQRGAGRRGEAVERAGGAQRWLEQRTAGRETREHMPLPGDGEAAAFLSRQSKGLVLGLDQDHGAAVELVAEAALGGGEQ